MFGTKSVNWELNLSSGTGTMAQVHLGFGTRTVAGSVSVIFGTLTAFWNCGTGTVGFVSGTVWLNTAPGYWNWYLCILYGSSWLIVELRIAVY